MKIQSPLSLKEKETESSKKKFRKNKTLDGLIKLKTKSYQEDPLHKALKSIDDSIIDDQNLNSESNNGKNN